MTIEERALTLIAKQLGVDQDKIQLSNHFMNDLGADSLALVDLTMAVEAEFGIEISDENVDRLVSVRNLVEYLQKNSSPG